MNRVPSEAIIEQTSASGALPTALGSMAPGQSVSATVDIDESTLKTQLASPGVLAADRLLLTAAKR